MKVLLTGTSGFLGSALARHWVSTHQLQLIAGREGFAGKLVGAEPVEVVVHAGFEVSFRTDPESVARNLASAEAIVNFFRQGKAKALLFVSAAGVMGVGAQPAERGEECFGQTDPGFEGYQSTAYIEAKQKAEALFRAASIPLTVIYPTTVFGRGMPEETIRGLTRGMIAPPGGTSFLGLEDFLAATDLALANKFAGEGYVLNGGNLLFRDLFHEARKALGQSKFFFILPRVARYLLRLGGGGGLLSTAVLESAFGYKYYSAAKFRRQFGWQPKQDVTQALAFLMEKSRE